jgi:hypothetical protein
VRRCVIRTALRRGLPDQSDQIQSNRTAAAGLDASGRGGFLGALPGLVLLPARPKLIVLLALSGSDRTSYASLICLNLASASGLPGLTSGWCWRASLRYADRISFSDAVLGTPNRA